MVQYEIKITGRVQGVGFRFYTQQQARILKLNGWVKNTIDGGVLTMIQCENTEIETFIDYLWIGPPLSQITNITKVKMQVLEKFTTFEIRY